jgi:hypothetical protein
MLRCVVGRVFSDISKEKRAFKTLASAYLYIPADLNLNIL